MPTAPVFFIDRSLESKLLVNELSKAGLAIEPHSRHFQHDTPDPLWLRAVTQNDWIILTCDRHIISRAWELEVLFQAGAGVIFLIGGQLTAADKAQILLSNRQKIEKAALETKRPFALKLYRDGTTRFVNLNNE